MARVHVCLYLKDEAGEAIRGWIDRLPLDRLAFGALLVAPFIAYAQTFKPIYVVDGYVRYRGPDDFSEPQSTGYVAVLFEDSQLCCEWEFFGKHRIPNTTIAAHVEFSEYGGIHKVDGKSTGVLPDELPTLAIGISQKMRR